MTQRKSSKEPKAVIAPCPPSEPVNIWRRIPTKGFVLTCALIILLPFTTRAVQNYTRSSMNLKKLIIVEGEKPAYSNYLNSVGLIAQNSRYFGGRSLQLDAPTPPSGSYNARYEFEIPEDGDYAVYLAGTPPGPIAIGSPWHSPYSIAIDNESPKLLTEETLTLTWPYLFAFPYTQGGYYFTKIAAAHLDRGTHTVTISVNRGRMNDGHFTLYIDALIIAPKNLKPDTHVGKIPKDLFYD